MAVYRCLLLHESGRLERCRQEAVDRAELLRHLERREVKLLSAHRVWLAGLQRRGRRVRPGEFLLANRKLSVLLKAGTPMLAALEAVLEGVGPGSLQRELTLAMEGVRGGQTPSEALGRRAFPRYRIYRAVLMAGEKSGALPQLLDRFNAYLEQMVMLRRRTLTSMAYPAFLLLVMLGLSLVILVGVLPQFTAFFSDFGSDLPWTTRLFMDLSGLMQRNVLWLLLLPLLLLAGLRFQAHHWPRLALWERFLLRIPFLGALQRDQVLAGFSRTLAILLDGGVVVPQAVGTACASVENRWLRQALEPVAERIVQGEMLSEVLASIPQIPGLLTHLIRVGEGAGNLPEVLRTGADHFEQVLDSRLAVLLSLLEPVMMVFLGLLMAFMLVSIYLPIFNLSRTVV